LPYIAKCHLRQVKTELTKTSGGRAVFDLLSKHMVFSSNH
jgi:hypothetical protein